MKFDPEFIGLTLFLVGIVIAGIVLVIRVRRWRDEEPGPYTPEAQIESFRSLVEQGVLDPKDFERIKPLLEKKPETAPAAPPSPSNPNSESFQAPPGSAD